VCLPNAFSVPPTMSDRAVNYILEGILALILSVIMWKLTGSFLGWVVFSVPGSALVLYGWYLIIKDELGH
jgi:hypothetical protein